MNLDPAWLQPSTSWNAKLARAREHVESLRGQVRDYRASEPYELKPESTEVPERLAYRLSIWRPQPTSISTTVGDIVHNLRTALENLAFGLALSSQGTLTPKQEAASTFPIKRTPTLFNEFITGRGNGLYSGRARDALRAVQPFAQLDDAHKIGVALDKQPGAESDWDLLYRLDKLWNIDKHRRLVVGEWLPRDFWWSSNGPTKREIQPGDGTCDDGSVLFYIVGSDEGMGDKVYHHFNLVLKDDPAFGLVSDWSEDVVTLMEQFQNRVDSVIRTVAFKMGNP